MPRLPSPVSLGGEVGGMTPFRPEHEEDRRPGKGGRIIAFCAGVTKEKWSFFIRFCFICCVRCCFATREEKELLQTYGRVLYRPNLLNLNLRAYLILLRCALQAHRDSIDYCVILVPTAFLGLHCLPNACNAQVPSYAVRLALSQPLSIC